MTKKLVIVESPSKSKTIEKYLGSDYTVMASKGHVRDLPKNKLGVDIDKGYAPQYLEMSDKKDISSKEIRLLTFAYNLIKI